MEGDPVAPEGNDNSNAEAVPDTTVTETVQSTTEAATIPATTIPATTTPLPTTTTPELTTTTATQCPKYVNITDGDRRHYNEIRKESTFNESYCDKNLNGWYTFYHDGKAAGIPTHCIKEVSYCSVVIRVGSMVQ